MSFDDFEFTINNLSNRLRDNKRRLGFYVKLNDGNTIEFRTRADYNWKNLFIIECKTHLNPPKFYGFLSVSMWDKEKNETNIYVVPCENIAYIRVKPLEDENDDSHLITW